MWTLEGSPIVGMHQSVTNGCDPRGPAEWVPGMWLDIPLAREVRSDTVEPGMAFPARALQQLRGG